MQLHVILGPPGAGKAGRAVGVLREAAADGVDAFLCVPGAVDRARFLRELGGESGVLLGIEVGTFDQLLERVAGSPPVRRTDRAMERMIVRDALRQVPAFADAVRWSGFVETARHHVDRLRRARVWGGPELDRAEQELPGQEVAHWRDLEARVGALLDERRLRDDAWFERRAAGTLRAGRCGVGAVVVHGFESLAPARLELLEQLAAQVPVTITLAWRPGRRVYERAATLRDRWRSRGAFIEELEPVAAGDPTLDWLASELFEDLPAPRPARTVARDAPEPVAFVDCCGPVQEAEEVVREVALLAGRGLAWDDIVVASADAAQDATLLRAAFERAGIPARVQAHRRAVDVPAGQALHELVDAVLTRDPLRLAAVLRAPVFGGRTAELEAVELRLRGRRHRANDLLHDPSVRRLLRPEVRGLLDAGAPGSGDAVPAMRQLLGSLRPVDRGELDLLRGIVAMLEGLALAAGGERHVALADVRDAMEAFPLTVPDRSDAGTVVVASIEDLRSIAFDAVVLRGMHLAGFRPRVDDEAEAPTAGRDLLQLAVTRARRTLRVIRQAAGSDGSQLAPSPAWQELRRLLPDAPLRARRLGEVLVSPAAVRLGSELEPAVALASGRGVRVLGVEPAVTARLEQLARRPRATRVDGPLRDELAGVQQLSVTSVERYALCPAKWFIEHRLRASDPDDDPSRRVEGQLAHALLQRLVPEVRGASPVPVDVRARARTLADQVVPDLDARGLLDAPRIERVTEHVVALVEGEQAWQTPDSIDVERSFGSGAPDAIGPGLDVDGVELVGRIDRIDRHGSRLLLHDYKYAASDRSARTLLADRNLQLLVYWLALEQPGSGLEPIAALYRAVTRGGAPSGVFCDELRELGVIATGVRAGVLDEAERRELLDAALHIVRAAVAGIRDGHVAPLDDPSACPPHCRLQTICRVGEEAAC